MSEIVRHIEGFGQIRAVAHWLPVRWIEWDDAGVMPAGVPQFMWTEHHGHNAAMRQSAFGVHAFRCGDCDIDWQEIEGINRRDGDKVSERRKIYVVESGEYSDYSVQCAFEDESDAQGAVAAGVGDDYREMVLFAPGAQPKKTISDWWASARTGTWKELPHVHPSENWDYDEVSPPSVEVYAGRPEVTERRMADGVWIQVKAADRESALKACSDRYAKYTAEEQGL